MTDHEWPQARRLGVFATFIFVVLFANGFPFSEIPIVWDSVIWILKGWDLVVPWVAEHVLHVGFDVQRARRVGGEPTKEYVRVGLAAVLALVGGFAWGMLDRRRTDARKVDQWLRLYLRLFLVAELFSYGLDKVFPMQFSPVDSVRLSQQFGEVDAGAFLWAFMGYSTPYQIFAGLGETMAGALLCFRRTTTLGALIGVAVMSNVVMLNFAFDVGVKLHSTFYLLGCIYLAAPGLLRLLGFYLFDRPMDPVPPEPFLASPGKNRLVAVTSGLLCAFLFVWYFNENWSAYQNWGPGVPKPALYGLYDVESVGRNGVATFTASVDSTRWSRLAIGDSRTSVRIASGSLSFYSVKTDTLAHNVRFTLRSDTTTRFTLAYSRPDSVHLRLQGRIGGDSVDLLLARRDLSALPLMQPRLRFIYDRPKVP